MITEKQIDKLIQRLMERMQEANEVFLEQIGSSLKKLKTLTPTQAHQLVQILKYGGNYEEIIKEISRITNLNIKEVDTIFKQYAKKDYEFFKDFYEYRNIPFVEYENNLALVNQTQALANIMKTEMYNYTRENIIGYTIRNAKGNVVFRGLRETYNDLLDRALMNVGQGKETFDNAIRDVLKDLGESGLRTLDYTTGRSIRLDSAVKMHLKGRLRELHNENQRLIAEEIDADGVEISVHEFPAPDHEDAQGHQLTNEEFNKLQLTGRAKDYKGKILDLHRRLKSGIIPDYHRPISEMNCYHYIFAIVLGVNRPQYSDKELQEIKERNEEGFVYQGQHYTMYEGTQLQRMLERRIREQKDIQILAKKSGDEFLAGESQNKIKALNRVYKEINEASGLSKKANRTRVSGYKTSAESSKAYNDFIEKYKVGNFDSTKYTDRFKPSTNEVVFLPDRKKDNNEAHPDDIKYYDKIQDIFSDPNQVYIDHKFKNTMVLVKEIDGHKVETIVRINTDTLYGKKEIGYKNSIIHLHTSRDGYIRRKVNSGRWELIFDKK